MSKNKPAVMSPDFYINKINERGYEVQMYYSPGDVLIVVWDKDRRIDQESGAFMEATLGRLANRVLNATAGAAA